MLLKKIFLLIMLQKEFQGLIPNQYDTWTHFSVLASLVCCIL